RDPLPLCGALCSMTRRPPRSPPFPYTTLFRSARRRDEAGHDPKAGGLAAAARADEGDELVVADLEREVPDGLARPEGLRQAIDRSEEHTSELQSTENLVCRLLLEKKKQRMMTC